LVETVSLQNSLTRGFFHYHVFITVLLIVAVIFSLLQKNNGTRIFLALLVMLWIMPP
jgi:hypothetical protein